MHVCNRNLSRTLSSFCITFAPFKFAELWTNHRLNLFLDRHLFEIAKYSSFFPWPLHFCATLFRETYKVPRRGFWKYDFLKSGSDWDKQIVMDKEKKDRAWKLCKNILWIGQSEWENKELTYLNFAFSTVAKLITWPWSWWRNKFTFE